MFARHGVELSRSTLCRWALQTAEILEPLCTGLMIELGPRLRTVIHTDDTPVPVLDSGVAEDPHGSVLGLLRRLAESVHGV